MYLGPLGNLRKITPLTNIDLSPTRYGGVHTALSGRRTVDYLGARETYQLAWRMLPPAGELAWLEALYHRHVPGPLRLLIGPQRPNRLSRAVAALGYGGRDLAGIDVTDGVVAPSPLWPAEADPAGVSLSWRGWNSGDGMAFGPDEPVPVLPGETVTASVWVRSAAADQVRLRAALLTAPTTVGDTVTGAVTTLAPDTWTRLSVTTTPDVDAPGHTIVAVLPALEATARVADTAELLVAAAQVEAGDTAGLWHLGGGAPLVAVDTLSTVSPWAPLTRPTMTLLEL